MILEPGFSFGGLLDQASPTEAQGSDRYWMKEALRESMRGSGITNPNPAVGCVIVNEGREVARGYTQAYRGSHAERHAFEQITDPSALVGATVYLTLEPCAHHGNQPPCVERIASSPVRRVVIARGDPDPRVSGRGIARLREAGKEVSFGPFFAEATAWNFPFLATQALGRPLVALKWAQTLDGQLADDEGTSKWISGPEARAYTHRLRHRYDLILVGARTFLADRPRLTVRDHAAPILRQPLRVILDPRGRCLEAIRDCPGPWVILTQADAPVPRNQEELQVLRLPNTHEFATAAIEVLSGPEIRASLGRPLQSIFVEGGPRVLTEFLKEGLADLVHAFVSPIFTGGANHRLRPEFSLAQGARLHLAAHARLGDDLLMEMVPPSLLGRIHDSV